MNIKPIAFTVRFNGKAKELKTPVKLYSEENINPGFNNIKDAYIAMWDTGSNMTVISDKLAKEMTDRILSHKYDICIVPINVYFMKLRSQTLLHPRLFKK